MKLLKLFVTVLALVSFPHIASAQDSGAYGGIGITTFEFDTYGINAKLGYDINKNFSVEGEGFLGVGGESGPYGNPPTTTSEIDYSVAAYAVVRLPLSEQFDIFARGGYHNTKLSLKSPIANVSGDIDGFALGGGLQYNLSDTSSIRADYTYLDGKFSDFDTVSISYVRRF